MQADVTVNISYNDHEVKKAVAFWLLRINKIRTLFFVAYPCLILASLCFFLYGGSIVLAIACVLIGVLIHCFFYVRPLAGYKEFYGKRKGGTYTFGETRVLITGAEIESTVAWTMYKKAYETPVAFLLLDDNRFVYVFPKSCFNDMTDMDKLRNLLIRKTAYVNYAGKGANV